MKHANWVWWTTEPLLRRVYLVLATMAASYVTILIAVLLAADGDASLLATFAQADYCAAQPLAVAYQREGLQQALARAGAPTPVCDRSVSLPERFGPLAPITSADPVPAAQVLGGVQFRLRYSVPSRWPNGEELVIYVPRLNASAWEVWIDGVKVKNNLNEWRMTWNRPLLARLDAARVVPGKTIAVQIRVAYIAANGHALSRIFIGPGSVVGRWYAWRDFLQRTLPQAIGVWQLVVAVFFFGSWLSRRRESAHLLLALTSVAWCISNLQYVLPRQDAAFLENWYDSVVSASVPWFILTVYLFLMQFGAARVAWLERTLAAFVLIMTVLALPVFGIVQADGAILYQTINFVFSGCFLVAIAVIVWRAGQTELRIIGFAVAIAVLCGGHDVALLAQRVNPESIYLLPYAGLFVFGSFFIAIQRRYTHALDRYEELTQSLAEKVAKRESELMQSYERLRAIEREQTLADERHRLMRDIHDGVGSALSASLVAVERGRAKPDDFANILRECIDDLRVVIDSLDPVNTDLVSLLATLRFRMGRRLEAMGTHIDWDVRELPQLAWIGPTETLHIMRMVQELLANTLKHAAAQRVYIGTGVVGDEIEVRVSDDGVGFDIQVSSRGRGLRFLKQRASGLGGKLEIASAPGQGTTARLLLPIQRETPTAAA
jgi:signal transduction histidine kinase